MRIGKSLSLLTVTIVIGLVVQRAESVAAQDRSQTTAPAITDEKIKLAEEKRAAEIESFISYAQSVPAEFSADLLIQLVDSGEIKDAKRKQQLLVEAFYAAAKAKLPVKLAAIPASEVDSRAGYRVTASYAGFDVLTLQCRVIKALLSLNKKKARQLFSEIKFTLEPLRCADPFAYDGDVFYTTIQAVAQTAFTAEEMRHGEHVAFVENYVSKINSPTQIQAAAKLLISLTTTDLELMNLGRALSSALQRLPSDYRSFSTRRTAVGSAIQEVLAQFSRQGLSTDELLEAYRTYLISQLSGPRCGDTGTSAEQQTLETSLIKHFNEGLRTSAYKKIPPIADEEIKSTSLEAKAAGEPFWKSAKAGNILLRIKRLRFSFKGKDFSDEEKKSPEWQSRLSEVVKDLAAWGPEDEQSEEDYFHQKSVIYYALLPTIPADTQYDGMRDEVLRDFTTMLSTSPLQKEKPSEWFLHARVLIDRVNQSQPPERDKLLNLVYSSRSTVLHLYVQKQQLFTTQKL